MKIPNFNSTKKCNPKASKNYNPKNLRCINLTFARPRFTCQRVNIRHALECNSLSQVDLVQCCVFGCIK
jgi:hypothetical protein